MKERRLFLGHKASLRRRCDLELGSENALALRILYFIWNIRIVESKCVHDIKVSDLQLGDYKVLCEDGQRWLKTYQDLSSCLKGCKFL